MKWRRYCQLVVTDAANCNNQLCAKATVLAVSGNNQQCVYVCVCVYSHAVASEWHWYMIALYLFHLELANSVPSIQQKTEETIKQPTNQPNSQSVSQFRPFKPFKPFKPFRPFSHWATEPLSPVQSIHPFNPFSQWGLQWMLLLMASRVATSTKSIGPIMANSFMCLCVCVFSTTTLPPLTKPPPFDPLRPHPLTKCYLSLD